MPNANVTQEEHPIPTLEWEDEFIASLQGSTHTAATYRQALRNLSLFFSITELIAPTDQVVPTVSLKDDLLVKYMEWLTSQRVYKTRTIMLYLAAIKRYLGWLDAYDRLPASFSMTKAWNRVKDARGRARRPSEVAIAVDPDIPRIITYYDRIDLPKATGPRLRLLRNRAIVHTMYASAGRVSEVASLTRAQVLDGRQDEILIRGKGGRDRLLLLTPEAQKAIAAYCQERSDNHPALFISHGRNKGKALGRWTLWNVVKDAAKALGLYQGTSPHHFRHYRARQLLHEGMDLEVLQTYLGHADVATTRRIYAPFTSVAKVKDQLATYGRTAMDAVRDEST